MPSTLGPLGDLFSSDGFMPHGHCYLWNPALVTLHVASDAAAAIAYTAIPISLVYFARRRRDLPFRSAFWWFGLFVVGCGVSRTLDIWTLWTPVYWLAGVVKAMTAILACATAVVLVRVVPKALEMTAPRSLRAKNAELRAATEELRSSQTLLAARIEERTTELQKVNADLRKEIGEKQQAESALRVSQDTLRHAQKMEAVGRLAGGVAHDFNNLLSVVLSYSSMLLDDVGHDHPMAEGLKQIEDAGQRAASLTQQLLAFSRQQVLQPKATALNDVVVGIEKMLRRVIGEHITLESSLDSALGLVHVDPRQMEQVIVNLVVNARDALPKGGTIKIRTSNVAPKEEGQSKLVLLEISDDGIGMDAVTLERAYEPFFTTKEVGDGTGLGLATVFGIVQQSGARIDVESKVGVGTTFRIYFRRLPSGAAVTESQGSRAPAAMGTETILVVEDETVVRNLIVEILRRHGYNVLAAPSGQEALALCEDAKSPIHLLVTDVVMPLMDGRELAQRVASAYPNIRILLMSGYPNDVLDPNGSVDGVLTFLRKPIQPKELARRVRAVLNAPLERR